ncbi:MAG: 3-deoxy-manno-octulosonate cytidylyltransferase [Armatimonadota bacterium]
MKNIVIIPVRLAATRFPNKPLADICGKPMVQWVYERAKSAKLVSDVIVAACDDEVIKVVESFGGKAVMTSPDHQSGTDRIAEVASFIDCDIVINVQGDEPLINPASIDKAMEPFNDTSVEMASLMVEISREDAKDPNLVKVVVDKDCNALYFSRSLIPYDRKPISGSYLGHVGLYAYRRDFLLEMASWKQTNLEITESLEQLRVLEMGKKIKMILIDEKPMGVDTPEDLDEVCKLIESNKLYF